MTTTTTQYASGNGYIYSYDANTNHGNGTHVDIGRYGSYYARTLLKFDLSGVPYGNICASAVLNLTLKTDYATSNCTWKAYRLKRPWIETQATWNQYASGVAWQTAGASGANDIDLTELGTSTTISQSSGSGTTIQISLNPIEIQKMYDGTYVDYGFLIKSSELATDYWETYSRSYYTGPFSYRPKLDILTNPAVDPSTNLVVAEGGDEKLDNGYKIHTFTSSGSFIVSDPGYVEVLVVGGGGGGGNGDSDAPDAGGGGGGAGGRALYNPSFYVNSGSTTITVGGGGNGAIQSKTSGSSGNPSSFFSIIASGGGGGKGATTVYSGSGGGGGGLSSFKSGIDGYQGMSGGNGGWNYSGGGGGGSGQPGTTPTSLIVSGSGGNGLFFSISGRPLYYGGGGGGGGWLGNSLPGGGGLGGGGNGGGIASGSYLFGYDATPNSGGGGGGGGTDDANGYRGGNGASGIVIIRYLVSGSQIYDQYTKSLLHFDGTDGSYYFKDEVPNTWTPYRYPSTSGSGAIIKTDQKKFGTASGYFAGSAIGDWVQTETQFDLSTTDWTMEAQIYPSFDGIGTLWSNRALFGYDYSDSTIDTNYWGFYISGSASDNQKFGYREQFSGSTVAFISGSIMPLIENTWQHVAFVRQGSSIKGYFNGTLYLSGSCSASIAVFNGQTFRLCNFGFASMYRGYMDEFRLSNVARWTSDFTPPVAPYAPTTPISEQMFYRQPFMYSSYPWL